MRYAGLTRLNLDELVFENVPGLESPYVPSGSTRSRLAMFSPRNEDGLLYIAAGNDDTEDILYNTTWMLDVKAMQWTQKASHDFTCALPQSDCSSYRCYVHGGVSNFVGAKDILNVFFEYDYQMDRWKNMTTFDTPFSYSHGFVYYPPMDALVTFGGIGRRSGSSPSDRYKMQQVSIFSLKNSSWVHHWDPPEEGDKVELLSFYLMWPLCAVYNDAIYIATAMLPGPSRLLKLTFEEPIPTFHHLIMENDELLPAYSRGQVGALIGDHFLVIGGVHASDPLVAYSAQSTFSVTLLSLC